MKGLIVIVNNEFNLYLQNYLEALQTSHGKVLVFFKGFDDKFFTSLKTLTNATLHKEEWLLENGYIDPEELLKNKTDVLIQFLTAGIREDELIWGFYEELILLLDNLQDMVGQFKGTIFVVENNIFKQNYFLSLPSQYNERISNYFKNEKLSDNEEVLSLFYSDCLEYPVESLVSLSFIEKHKDEKIETKDFYIKSDLHYIENEEPEQESLYIKDFAMEVFKRELQRGERIKDMIIRVENKKDSNEIAYLTSLANLYGIKIQNIYIDRFNMIDDLEKDQHLSYLKRYWGEESTYRTLKFYKNPDLNNEVREISQGNLINTIIEQSEKSLKDNAPEIRDIFITAPTGSGKSVLFQIPSIYLAEQYEAVTIVITPLVALMKDQVENLKLKNQVEIATFINSDISFQEREQRLIGIRKGRYSIVYISPELFLSNALESLIGSRRLGLLVVDEAHLVTTWGRDFRADYWYLGSYLEKMRRMEIPRFPVLCLTATAVYQGQDDIVNETIESLNLRDPILFLGNVKRDDLLFDIQPLTLSESRKSHEEFKEEITAQRIKEFVELKQRSLIYCPYTRQVDDIYEKVNPNIQESVKKYYGQLDKHDKTISYESFRDGMVNSMICTKAFGMGVDISDIQVVYHHAPTGYLPDYLQEIGRAARRDDIVGIAKMDYSGKDMKYVRMLHGLSGIRHYQLQEMVRKIYQIYKEKNKRSFLVSSDAFSYLFPEKDLETKVKNGLMLISKDFEEEKYKFPVINIRPKSMYTSNFVNVPSVVEVKFVDKFGEYVKAVDDYKTRVLPTANKLNGATTIKNNGHIYEVDMAGIWEKHFNELTFPQFKLKFFNGELLRLDKEENITARAKVKILFSQDYEKVMQNLQNYLTGLTRTFAFYKNQGSMFTRNEFKERFKKELKINVKNKDITNLILDMFVADISQNVGFNQNSDPLKFIQSRKSISGNEQVFRVMNSNFNRVVGYFVRSLGQCYPNTTESTFSTYIPFHKGGKIGDVIKLSIILELFELGSYEVIGGKNMEIFIRINDPGKLRNATENKYTNLLLQKIDSRRKYSEKVFLGFMHTDLTTDKRWELIEHYFLGKDELVANLLGLNSEEYG